MIVTREMLIKMLAEKSGYYQRDVRILFQNLDDTMIELFGSVPDDEELLIQLFEGCRLKAKVVKERERVDPRNGNPIICPNTVKLGVKYSEVFKEKIQERYEERKDG